MSTLKIDPLSQQIREEAVVWSLQITVRRQGTLFLTSKSEDSRSIDNDTFCGGPANGPDYSSGFTDPDLHVSSHV